MTQATLESFLPEHGAEPEQLVHRMGIDIAVCRPGRVVGSMPIRGNHQPLGILHGGANAVLAETLGSLAAFLHAGEGGNAVGTELSCTHHRWASSGTVTGICTPLHESGSTASYEIVITDHTGRRTCTARLTCAIRPRHRRNGERAAMASANGADQ
ncbi:hotdog fold thioesterase [Nocardiopsis sp. CNT312]|uniref:hotdog fold thioesterase n=1 Tax=Nocardiopsis sp. CNT312 TaxID=1137268 RepID=UPI00048A853C|nr:hotdog fold thioesterase [Nocardiopsis sp. CNT312]